MLLILINAILPKTATSIQKSKCYVSPPYYDELSEKMKRIYQDYYISTQITAVNTLMKSSSS